MKIRSLGRLEIFFSFSGLVLAIFLVFLNGFFVAAEFSLVKLRQTQVQQLLQLGGLKGRLLYKIHQKLDAYLSACQLGITFASLGLGWVGEPAFSTLLAPILGVLGVLSPSTLHFVSLILGFSVISFLHIVVGELMPKSMAIRQPGRISLMAALPLFLFYWLMYPAIFLLNVTANKLLKIFKLDQTISADHSVSTQELKLIFKLSHAYGELTRKELEILNRLIELYDLQTYEVMRPLEDLVALDVNNPFLTNFRQIKKYRFSRYPLYQKDLNHIVGILHTKDLLSFAYSSKNPIDFRKVMRPLMKVKTTTSALELLDDFRRGEGHFALVYQDQDLVGFVTFDHLIQVILGRVKDEFHITEEDWIDLPDGSYLVKGSAPLYSLERLFNIDLSTHPYATVLGWVMGQVKHLPKVGYKVNLDHLTLGVEKGTSPKDIWFRVSENRAKKSDR